MKFDDDFKKAISLLPNSEKDKLILRLLKRDLALANKLYFELLSTDNEEDRRKDEIKSINQKLESERRRFYSPGILMMVLRDLSGSITEHVKITGDKYGEVFLYLLVLNKCLADFNPLLDKFSPKKSYKFNVYIVAKIFKIMVLLNKMHEDLQYEFINDIKTLGKLISQNENLYQTAINNKLDVNWLLNCNIPKDIASIEKQIRNQGFLK
ncbi:MAG: hypothetical protein LBT29_07105 [Flavobacteriaceae bacterium]|jgi:hypothetical protein|nr:hypothetical protein [Flavobacteriaceae bacterium]